MRNHKEIITPVKREDFKENFGGNTTVENIDPLQYFKPLIEQFKKLAPGPYFWFVADTVKGIPLATGGVMEKIVAIKEAEFVNHPPDQLFMNMHPEDGPKLFAFTNYYISYIMQKTSQRKLCIRPTIYIRLLSPEKIYKWTMIQYAENILDAEGRIAYGLTLVTDISHIKKDGVAMMSILDSYDDSCQHFFCSDGNAVPNTEINIPKISPREIEVLRYLAIGNSSKQIASELNIAVKTVDNHRQSLLKKTKAKSSGELVAYGINMGFL